MLPLFLGDDGGCLAGANPTIEKYFHDCIYDTRDLIGFYFGLCSITCWMVAQLPQLITNYHRQSAEALSPFFLAQWLLGDTCNLVGALLKGDQPETVILTAQYFICMDVVLLLQYLYYTAVSRRLERTYVLAAARRHHRHGHHHHGHHTTSRHSIETHHHHHYQRHQHTNNSRPEAEEQRLNISTETQEATGETSNHIIHEIESSGTALLSNSRKRTKNLATGAAAITTVACSLVLLLQNETISAASGASFASLTLHMKQWEQSAGSVLGYTSCILYLASRISQILKNIQRKSAEGLASSMFLCAVAANLFYGTSVLLRSRTKDEVISSLPWALGSLGTVALDGVILVQTVMFAREERKNTHHVSTAHVDDGNRSDIEQPLLEGSDEHGLG